MMGTHNHDYDYIKSPDNLTARPNRQRRMRGVRRWDVRSIAIVGHRVRGLRGGKILYNGGIDG